MQVCASSVAHRSGGDVGISLGSQSSQPIESQSSGVCLRSDLSQAAGGSAGPTQDPAPFHAQVDPAQKRTGGPRSALSLLAAAGTHLLGKYNTSEPQP